MMELLAPAGNFAKLETALHFGADACYLGGKRLSLRSLSENFTDEELRRAVALSHARGKKVYVAVNIFARDADFAEIERFGAFLASIGADAALVSDPGVLDCLRVAAPDLALHLSTQANATNARAVEFWKKQGVERVVLARELSLAEIAQIHAAVPEMELEVFVHGAMCISYSGRCLLSDYLDGRPSNRGMCVQACRQAYELRRSDGGAVLVEEDRRGTYFLNSKDLNLSAHLPALEAAGVRSLKIEGRMKSEYYVATVLKAYRRALDEGYSPAVFDELQNAAHREYTTAYALGDNRDTVNYDNAQSKGACEFIGTVLGRDGEFLLVEMRNRFRRGDRLELLSPHAEGSFSVEEMFAPDGAETEDAKLVQGVYRVRSSVSAEAGDLLRRRRKI